MSTITAISRPSSSGSSLAPAVRTFFDEASTLLQALVSPGRIIRDVEAMRALQVQANRVEATDPLRAAALRRRASLIGLR